MALKINTNTNVTGVRVDAPKAIYKSNRVQKNIPIRQKNVITILNISISFFLHSIFFYSLCNIIITKN